MDTDTCTAFPISPFPIHGVEGNSPLARMDVREEDGKRTTAEGTNAAQALANGISETLATDIIHALIKAGLFGALYLAYLMIRPYSNAILGGIFLSIVMHPTNCRDAYNAALECERELKGVLRRCMEAQMTPEEGPAGGPVTRRRRSSWVIAVAQLLWYVCTFVTWCCTRSALFVGADKFPLCGKRPTVRNVAAALYLVMFAGCLLTMQFVASVLGALLVLYLVLGAMPLAPMTFIRTSKWIGIITVVSCLTFGVLYGVMWDLSELGSMMTKGGKTGIDFVSVMVDQYIPKETFDMAQEFVGEVRPILANLSFHNTSDWYSHGMHFYSRFTNGTSTDVRSTALTVGNSVLGIVGAVVTAFLRKVVDFFDLVYALLLFFSIFFVLKRSDQSPLYSFLQRTIHIQYPQLTDAELRERTEAREADIVGPLQQLLFAYWHSAAFHFTATYMLFSVLRFPYATTASFASSFIALFPFIPSVLPAFLLPVAASIITQDWGTLTFLILGVITMVAGASRLVSTQRVTKSGGGNRNSKAKAAKKGAAATSQTQPQQKGTGSKAKDSPPPTPQTPALFPSLSRGKQFHLDPTPPLGSGTGNSTGASMKQMSQATAGGLRKATLLEVNSVTNDQQRTNSNRTPTPAGGGAAPATSSSTVNSTAAPSSAPNSKAYDFAVQTAAILGLITFGLTGVIVGPCVAIVLMEGWRWGGERVVVEARQRVEARSVGDTQGPSGVSSAGATGLTRNGSFFMKGYDGPASPLQRTKSGRFE
jgi:hypothetical protein